jgi:hypothetical protein
MLWLWPVFLFSWYICKRTFAWTVLLASIRWREQLAASLHPGKASLRLSYQPLLRYNSLPSPLLRYLKGQCHEIFCFFFFMNQFPPSHRVSQFAKKFETALVVYSGAWGKMIHEKNQKSKILWHCPFKTPYPCKLDEKNGCLNPPFLKASWGRILGRNWDKSLNHWHTESAISLFRWLRKLLEIVSKKDYDVYSN